MNDHFEFGFKSYADVTALAWVTYGLLYFLVGGGMEAFTNPNVPNKAKPADSNIDQKKRQDLINQFEKLEDGKNTNKASLVDISDYIKNKNGDKVQQKV